MKTTLLVPAFLLISFLANAQDVDSTVIKQVDSLIQVSRTFADQRNFEKALEASEAAGAIARSKIGQGSLSYLKFCTNHANLFHIRRDYLQAEKWYLESMAISEKVNVDELPNYAKTLNNFGLMYTDIGQYEEAEKLLLQATATNQRKLEREHPDVLQNQLNLGLVYYRMARYEQAEELYQFVITAKAKQAKDLDYAMCLNQLALLYRVTGRFEKAEPLFLEAIEIRREKQGENHPDYAGALVNAGLLYLDLGDYKKTQELYLEGLAIREKTLGKAHPFYSQSINNLAYLYVVMGKFQDAEPLYIESIAIKEKNLGKGHPEYSRSLNGLANLYYLMGRMDDARQLYLEALSLREKVPGKLHPDYSTNLAELGRLYRDMGQADTSIILFQEALAIREKTNGKVHPDYAAILSELASTCQQLGDITNARQHYIELATVNRTLMANALTHLSERELGIYLSRFTAGQDLLLSFIQQTADNQLAGIAYDNILFYKGFLMNAAGQLRHLIQSDSAGIKISSLLNSARRRLATLYARLPAERDTVLIATLEKDADQLEKELTRTVAGYDKAMQQVQWQNIQQHLKPHETAVEFVCYTYTNGMQPPGKQYGALIVRPDVPMPLFVPLFPEDTLAKCLSMGNNSAKGELLAGIYSRGAQPVRASQQAGLYDIIWKPLSEALGHPQTIYYSPDGLLHRLNFDAITIPSSEKRQKTLGEAYGLVRLGSTRSIVISDFSQQLAGKEAVLYGGIQYDTTSLTEPNTTQYPEPPVSGELSFTYAYRSHPNGMNEWAYLPGTGKEIASIQKLTGKHLLSSQVFSGANATEESFKTIGKGKLSPRILHIATHGFFFPDPKTSARFQTSPTFAAAEPVFKISDHPMIRSGLLLAGANHAWATGKPLREGMEDGILTAYEISQMNLSNTELVVLSACETGLGDIQGNEGVYGLQRAFKIAGAKYLVMSLWQVPDQETSVFMTSFYRHWLEGKMSIPDAFRTTQQEMRERFINPYQWAGFVLVE